MNLYWNFIFIDPLVNILVLLYQLFFNNLGIAIIVLTLAIKGILIPITLPSQRSMNKMRDLAPEISKLKERHKNDKTKLMQAQADLYKLHGVSPAAGCLPQIVQLVVLIALFNVFTTSLTSGQDTLSKINSHLYSFVHQLPSLDTTFLYLDLTKPDSFHLQGIPFPLPGTLLVLAAIFQFISAKMMMPKVKAEIKKAKKTKGEMDDIMASTQQQMLYLFPVMTIFIGVNFSSGLVLYWFVFSVSQTVQQYMTSGWGGLTPWLQRLNLLQSVNKK